jgi:hypothetical protein
MEWFNYILPIVIILIAIVGLYFEFKTKNIKEWLLWAVVLAEKELGSGTGQLKLRYVYDLFVAKYSFISNFISFNVFSKWVDFALLNLKTLLEVNVKVDNYVNPKEV